MIASLHPCIRKDINILCAGRSLTDREKKRLQKARAVILPQGVTAEVYRDCRRLVPRVFPNYDLRFGLEGKVGDALLFEYFQVPIPEPWPSTTGNHSNRHFQTRTCRPRCFPGIPWY